MDCRHSMLDRQRAKLFDLRLEECIGADNERARTQFAQGSESQ